MPHRSFPPHAGARPPNPLAWAAWGWRERLGESVPAPSLRLLDEHSAEARRYRRIPRPVIRSRGKRATTWSVKLVQRPDGWWEIVESDHVLSAWPDRATARKIARLYGRPLD